MDVLRSLFTSLFTTYFLLNVGCNVNGEKCSFPRCQIKVIQKETLTGLKSERPRYTNIRKVIIENNQSCIMNMTSLYEKLKMNGHPHQKFISFHCLKDTWVEFVSSEPMSQSYDVFNVQFSLCRISIASFFAFKKALVTVVGIHLEKTFIHLRNPFCDITNSNKHDCELSKSLATLSIPQSTSGQLYNNVSCVDPHDSVKELSVNKWHMDLNTMSKLEWLFPNLQSLDISHSNVTLSPRFFWNAISDKEHINSEKNTSSIVQNSNMNREKVRQGSFLGTPRKYILKLKFNDVVNPEYFVFHGYLHTLDISCNGLQKINDKIFSGLQGLEKLIMTNNSLTDPSTHLFDNLRALKYLDLSFNDIQKISMETFSDLRNLEYLDLSHNRIKTIEKRSFLNLHNIEEIRMESNNIQYLSDELFPISSVPLKIFIADMNPLVNIPISIFYIKSLEKASFRNTAIDLRDIHDMLLRMDWFSLLNNVIKSSSNLNDNVFLPKTQKLREIDLSGTNVENIDLAKYTQLRNSKKQKEIKVTIVNKLLLIVKSFEFIFTNFICDCRINAFNRILNHAASIGKLSGSDYVFHKWKCSMPAEFRDKEAASIKETDTYIEKNVQHCPHNCTCFERCVNEIIIVDCQGRGYFSLPKSLPSGTLDIWFQHNNVSVIGDVEYLNRTRFLDLSNNRVEEMTGRSLKKMIILKQLYLNSNNLRTMPREIQKTNVEVLNINNNPFKCDCNSLWMKHWILQRSLTYSDIRDITCNVDDENEKGTQFLYIDDSEFVCLEEFHFMKDVIIPSVSSTFAVLTCVLALITLYVCRFEAKVLIFMYLKLHPFDLDDDDSREPVDVLVIHSPELTKWVMDNIVTYLENQNSQYVVCEIMRDFIPGFSLQENITSIVKHSKRMILVMSTEMMERQVLKLIWNEAQEKIKELRKRYVITVFYNVQLKDITNKEMLRYAKHGTMIASTDRLLCGKLLYCMPVLSDRACGKKEMPEIQSCVMNMYGDINLRQDFYERHVFISYSDAEIQYMLKYIKPVLEGTGYTLCLPDRDFIPGASKEENILKAIDSSLHTLFFVSENHLLDEWSIFTFRTAFEKSLRYKRNHLILILSENVVIDELDEEIKNIVNTHVILQIGEEWFVQKLLNAMSDAKPCVQYVEEEAIVQRDYFLANDALSITESMLFDNEEAESDTDNDANSFQEISINNEEEIEVVIDDRVKVNNIQQEQIQIVVEHNIENDSDDAESISTGLGEKVDIVGYAENMEVSSLSDEENMDVSDNLSSEIPEHVIKLRNRNQNDSFSEVESLSMCSSDHNERCMCGNPLELNIQGSICFNEKEDEERVSIIMNNDAREIRFKRLNTHTVFPSRNINLATEIGDQNNVVNNPHFQMKSNYDATNSDVVSDSDNNTDSDNDDSTL